MLTNIQIVDKTIHNNFGIELEREIGRGKYGVVYSGKMLNGNRNCAVKVISLPTPELEEKLRDIYGDNEYAIENAVREMAAKFENEIKSMSRLGGLNADGSRNIIRMYNHMLVQEGMYSYIIISMELALPLKRFLARENFTLGKVIQISYETAKGLKVCHEESIIHRDIKEDNLFIGADGRIKIGDFGVANISGGEVSKKTEGVGTPHYMAPEIKHNAEYDQTVDVYSLGIVMYMLLNENKPPFYSNRVDEHTAYQRRMAGEPLPNPMHAPKPLADIIRKCCSYDPRYRYRDIDLLLRDLDNLRNNMPPEALNRIVPYPKRTFADDAWWDGKFNGNADSGAYNETAQHKNILRDTIGAFRDLLQKFGNNSKEGQFIEGVYIGKGVAERDMNEAERKVKFMRRVLIALLCVVVVLTATMVLLYPKTASFYPNESDGSRVYAKYLFLPARRISEHSAAYVTTSGNEVYFSAKFEGKKLYKTSIWSGKEQLVCDKECHYDIIIGDYIYFTDNSPTGNLCRVKKDGTGYQCLIEENCGDLRNSDGNLKVWFENLGRFEIIDVNSMPGANE